MNKTQQYIIQASLFALACALFGGLWLVWQTIEESRALERQNRELQASLEASRIRVENFCEYPTDVLCRVDERSGTVAGALPGELPGLAELTGIPAPETVKKSDVPAPEASPSKALENVKKVAQAQAELVAPAEKTSAASTTSVEKSSTEKPVPPAPSAQSNEDIKTEALPATEAKPEKQDVATSTAQPEAQKETPSDSSYVPLAPQHADDSAASSSADTANSAGPAQHTELADKPALPLIPIFQQEVSGKLSDMVRNTEKANTDKPVPTAPQEAAPGAKPDTQKKAVRKTASDEKQGAVPRSTWSRIDLDGEIFAFTLTGSGPSLNASGKLLASPWRYELTLDGLWSIRRHEVVSNRLVSAVNASTRNGSTVVIFSLKKKPYKASLHRPDARTLSVRIR